jgi:putative phosphoesterase
MRVILIADVHANGSALLALQRAEPRPDAVLFAGDAVGYGPDPAACARWLASNARAVAGDHDAAAAEGAPAAPPPELDDAAAESLAWTRQQLGSAFLARLGEWPRTATVEVGGARFYLCHGTPTDPLAGRLHAATASQATLEALFAPVPADVIVLGHTHLPALRQIGPRVIVNPGSLGQPRYGLPDATYAVWDDGRLQIRHLHYDHHAVAARLRLTPLGPETLDALTETLETGLLPGWAAGPAEHAPVEQLERGA